MMRILSLLIFLAGVVLGFGYPWFARHAGVHDLGTWRVHETATGFQPVTTRFGLADAPVKAVVEVTAVRAAGAVDGFSVVTITAATGGRTVLVRTLDLSVARARDDSPQTPQQIYTIDAGEITKVEEGDYIFTLGPGDAEDVDVLAVDLILTGGAMAYDERVEPVGFSLVAIGFILLVLSFRRGDAAKGGNPNSQPPPRWGRGGSQ